MAQVETVLRPFCDRHKISSFGEQLKQIFFHMGMGLVNRGSLALLASLTVAGGAVVYAHYSQVEDMRRMHEGVERVTKNSDIH